MFSADGVAKIVHGRNAHPDLGTGWSKSANPAAEITKADVSPNTLSNEREMSSEARNACYLHRTEGRSILVGNVIPVQRGNHFTSAQLGIRSVMRAAPRTCAR